MLKYIQIYASSSPSIPKSSIREHAHSYELAPLPRRNVPPRMSGRSGYFNHQNYEEVMRCVSHTAAGENSSHRRRASGELPRRKIVYPIVTLITHTLSSIQGMQAHVHPTTIGSCFNQPIASTVVDTIASPTDSRGKYFMPLASTGATRSQQT